jgi:hypothetical protein
MAADVGARAMAPGRGHCFFSGRLSPRRVADHGLERVQACVGAQHEDAVEPLVFLNICEVNECGMSKSMSASVFIMFSNHGGDCLVNWHIM